MIVAQKRGVARFKRVANIFGLFSHTPYLPSAPRSAGFPAREALPFCLASSKCESSRGELSWVEASLGVCIHYRPLNQEQK